MHFHFLFVYVLELRRRCDRADQVLLDIAGEPGSVKGA